MSAKLSPRCKVAAASVGGALVALTLAFYLIRAAALHAPAFYDAALAADPVLMRRSSDELLESATALMNTSYRAGPWHAIVTEEQINGWLAIDLGENHADLLPAAIADPRIHLEPGRATIACRYRWSALPTIASVSVDVYLAEPHIVALRIRAARAGALPMPIKPIIDGIVHMAEQLNLQVQWRQAEGDPVALITLPVARAAAGSYHLDSLQLREGKLFVVGRTEAHAAPEAPSPSSQPPPQPDVAARPDENRKTQ